MKLTRRRFYCIMAALILLAVYFVALPHFTPSAPSPLEARAAMAEAGVCEPDAPIIERDGMVTIGGYPYNGVSFWNPEKQALMPSGGIASHGNFYYEPATVSWLPGGRWRVSPLIL